MKKFNKMLSVLLSLMLCLGMVVPGFAASLQDLQDAIDGTGGTKIGDTDRYGYGEQNKETEKWGIEAWDEDGTRNVQLNENVEKGEDDLTGVTVESGRNVELNLNGNNLTGDDEHDVIDVKENASLTINGGEAETDTPDETDEAAEAETPAEGPKNTITGDVSNAGALTVNKATIDGNVRNRGKFTLKDSAVTQTVHNYEGAIFTNDGSTVAKEIKYGSYGNGGTYTLEDGGAGGGQKLTIYPDSSEKLSSTPKGSWLETNGISNVTEVVIADGVTTIGNHAFDGCTGLTKVTIPGSVTSIEQSAFNSCDGLISVTIGDGVETIGQSAFQNCTGLTEVTIPGSVTTIKEFAFKSCAGLTSVTIGNGVETIEKEAFARCSRLESVTIPDSVKTIGEIAFALCSSLTSVTIGDGVETIGASAFYYCTGLTEVTIPDSVKTIGASAFSHCEGLKSVTIPDSVKTIGASAFFYCSGLTEVTIPNSVETIKAGAFDGCKPHRVIRGSDDGETVTYYLNGAKGFDYSPDVNDFYGDPSVTRNADGTVVVNSDDEKIEIKAVNGKNPVITENDGSITVTAGCKTVTVDTEGSITSDLSHTEVTDKAVEPTCTKTGLTEGKHCSVCGEVITAQTVIAAKGHTYGEWVVTTPAKPGKAGVETRTCSVCGKTETQAIAAQPVTTPVTGGGTPDYPVTGGITQIEDEAVPLAAGPVTRAEFIDYLWRHEGRPESDGVCTFTDVEKDHEYILALAWAEQNGIIEANEDGTFEPDELVTVAAVRDILDNFAEVFGLDVDVTTLASLTGEDDEAVLNCDEVIAEFFRKETEEQKAA